MVEEPPTPAQTKAKINRSLFLLNTIATLLQVSRIVLGAVSILGTIGIATFSKELEEKGFLKPVACTAAASSALILQFSLQQKSSDARRAWRLLQIAIMKNDSFPDMFREEQLIEAWSEAQTIMDDTIVIDTTPLQENDNYSQFEEMINDLENKRLMTLDKLENLTNSKRLEIEELESKLSSSRRVLLDPDESRPVLISLDDSDVRRAPEPD